jgi:hypothetical protein
MPPMLQRRLLLLQRQLPHLFIQVLHLVLYPASTGSFPVKEQNRKNKL